MLRITLLLLLSSISQLRAQTDSLPIPIDTLEPIPFIAYWSKGDIYKFQITKIDIQTKYGHEEKNDTSSYLGIFEVLDSTATSYTIKWTYENYRNDRLGEHPEVVAAVARSGLDIERVIYTTDELGTFEAIENMDELVAMTKTAFNAVMEGEEMKNLPDSARSKVRDILNLRATPQAILSSIVPELQLLHYPYGIEYLETDSISYDEMLPNLLGGDPFRATNLVLVDSVDRADDFIHLKQYTYVGKEEMMKLISTFLSSIGQAISHEEMSDVSFKFENDNDFYYYYYPGIPIYIDYQREVVFGDNEGDRVTLKRIEIEWVD